VCCCGGCQRGSKLLQVSRHGRSSLPPSPVLRRHRHRSVMIDRSIPTYLVWAVTPRCRSWDGQVCEVDSGAHLAQGRVDCRAVAFARRGCVSVQVSCRYASPLGSACVCTLCTVQEAREGLRPVMERVGLADGSTVVGRESTVDTSAATASRSAAPSTLGSPLRSSVAAGAGAAGAGAAGAGTTLDHMTPLEPGAMVDSQEQALARTYGRRPFSANRRFVGAHK
jgi:hypothetical protein